MIWKKTLSKKCQILMLGPVQFQNGRGTRTRQVRNSTPQRPMTTRTRNTRNTKPLIVSPDSTDTSDITDDIPTLLTPKNDAQFQDISSTDESSIDYSSDDEPKMNTTSWAAVKPNPQPAPQSPTQEPEVKRKTVKTRRVRKPRSEQIPHEPMVPEPAEESPSKVRTRRRANEHSDSTHSTNDSNKVDEENFITNEDSEDGMKISGVVSSNPTPNETQEKGTDKPANLKSLDISDTELFEVLRKKTFFGGPQFTLIQQDKTIYFTKYAPANDFKGYYIYKKNATDGDMIGYLREHQRKHRFTFYIGSDVSSMTELFGFAFIKKPEVPSRVRQIRIVYKKGFVPHYPVDKTQNLSRLARDYIDTGDQDGETNEAYKGFEVLESQVPKILANGTLTLSFGGATCNSSVKNFVFRIPGTNKCLLMCFRQANEMFKVRYTAPFDQQTAFAFSIAAFVGEG